jgi:DNA-binding LytR/AlgR family response regulator
MMRILILEDDPFIALDLEAIVEGQGHEVVGTFDSLADARAELARQALGQGGHPGT